MIGAIIGDLAGSRFEGLNRKSKNFRIFHHDSHITDDSVMSLAIAKAILECKDNYRNLSSRAVSCMQELGRKYPNAGYGGTFGKWILENHPKPYGSYGNGAAMRVGPCGFAAKDNREAKALSDLVTCVTHNHPEGMKGAEAIAVTIVLARAGVSKAEIGKFVQNNYYDINFTIDEIRPTYRFDVSCQGSVPVALEAFLESSDFEDAIRTAVSVGGDSDTIAAMAGSVAEAFYGVPEELILGATEYLDSTQMEILYRFEQKYPSRATYKDEATGKICDTSVFEVLDRLVDKKTAKGVRVYTGDKPPAKEGYTGMIIFSDPPVIDGSVPQVPVHVWVSNADLVPDFSSFDHPQR